MSGNDVGAVRREFLQALKAAVAKASAATKGMGLYDVAMTAGRPGLGGFAPVARETGQPVGQKSRMVAQAGEAGVVTSGRAGVQEQAGGLAARPGAGEAASYRAVLAQAQVQAAAGRARRESERAALNVPSRGTALGGMSFAPPPGGGAAGGVSLHPTMRGADAAPGLRRRGSVHGAVAAAEAGSAELKDAGGDEFSAAPAEAPAQVAPLDIERALENYFFQQSRLPPAGGAGFNPLLTPVWAGLKIPG